ncbi:uncharacterized protein LOC135210575 isoform X1 [Macrobrachium nipponense]|uniref:uncharacterized protein LOC135210575 isoform X1 n=1 Tax=Macrobrachium nipponense TaxID=159736 RepID=UPI0030C7D725
MFIGTLLSQAPSSRLPEHYSIRVLVMAWLIFAFIIGAAYRGNLIASLTLSKSPPRAETIDEINKAFDTILTPTHGNEFKKFFEMPGSAKTFQELARRMVIGTPIMPGLRAALTGKVAYMVGRRFAAFHIAQYFTNVDGSTKLYLAREDVLAGKAAWAIPHDAPFQPQIDSLMMAAIETLTSAREDCTRSGTKTSCPRRDWRASVAKRRLQKSRPKHYKKGAPVTAACSHSHSSIRRVPSCFLSWGSWCPPCPLLERFWLTKLCRRGFSNTIL